MSLEEIRQAPIEFANTAKLAQKAGFGGVQIHAAHGFLLSQFLSPLFNKRCDEFGGSIANRVKLLLQSIEATRAAVGPDFPIAVMVNGDYEFHRFNPQSGTFEPMGTTNGSSYYTNNAGVFVTVSRSSCCESGASVHQIVDNRLVAIFRMAIRPQDITTPETQCQIFSEGPLSREEIETENSDLVTAFCDYYEDTGQAAVRAWDRELTQSHVELPDSTAFFCVLEGGTKAVTIDERDQGFAYMFGGIGQEPDLELCRDDNIATMENDDETAGPLTGSISYHNGDYTYTLHSPRDAFGVFGTDERLYRLTAQLAGQDGYVFDQTCQPQAVHDFTFPWIAG